MQDENRYKHLNAKTISFEDSIDAPAQLPEIKCINVRGREEHEAVIKDAPLCEELGLDKMYEIMVYLKRWGAWLRD